VLGDVGDVDQAVLQAVTTNISPQRQRIIALGRCDGSFSPRPFGHASSPGYRRLRWASWCSVAGGRFPAFRHFMQRRRPARSWTQVDGTCGSAPPDSGVG
jgi:hypothetical protein